MSSKPEQFLPSQRTSFFTKKWGLGFVISLLVHLGLLLTIVYFSDNTDQPKTLPPKVLNAELITPEAKKKDVNEQLLASEQKQAQELKQKSDTLKKTDHAEEIKTEAKETQTSELAQNRSPIQKKVPSVPATEAPAAESPPQEQLPPSSEKLAYQGNDIVFSDPKEQAYYQQLLAHLQTHISRHPEGMAGQIRLQIRIQYQSVITGVSVIETSGNPALDNWAKTAMLNLSPVPPVPSDLEQPYYFRPTLVLTN